MYIFRNDDIDNDDKDIGTDGGIIIAILQREIRPAT